MRLLYIPAALLVGLTAISFSTIVHGYTNPITVKGYKMFDRETGKYFSARGIDYYPRPNTGDLNINNHDFFTDDQQEIWESDLAYLAATGANAVRLYAVDPSKSHDKFMCALRSYGMYALIDLASSCENCAVTADKYPDCYPSELKTRGEQIILAFAQYDNVLAFSAGNEVNHVVKNATTNAPCQKKFIRDMRKFISSCTTIRDIPVGAVLADPDNEDNNREVNAKYYNCRTDPDDKYENAEWYGLNTYQFCDGTVTDVADAGGYQQLLSDFTSYKMSIPVILTEIGCVNPSFPTVDGYDAQRTWLDAGWLHTSAFREVFSGGFAFEYSTEYANANKGSPYPFTSYGPQNYGLGYFSPEDCDHVNTPCIYNSMPNYDNLATQYNATDESGEASMEDFTVDSTRASVPSCPTNFPKLADVTWDVDSVDSLSCPTSVLQYKCPNQKTSDTWASTSGSGSSTISGTTESTDPTTNSESTGASANQDNTEGTSASSSASAIATFSFPHAMVMIVSMCLWGVIAVAY